MQLAVYVCPCFVAVNQLTFRYLPTYYLKRGLYLFGTAADDVFDRACGKRYIEYAA